MDIHGRQRLAGDPGRESARATRNDAPTSPEQNASVGATALDTYHNNSSESATGLAEQMSVPKRGRVATTLRKLVRTIATIFTSPDTYAMLAMGFVATRSTSRLMRAFGAYAPGAADVALLRHVGGKPWLRTLGLFSASRAIEGALFHTGMNAWNVARGKREAATWTPGAYGKSVALFHVLGATNVFQSSLRAPIGAAAKAARFGADLGLEAGALSALAVGEAAIRGQSLADSKKIFLENLEFLVAMRMLGAAQKTLAIATTKTTDATPASDRLRRAAGDPITAKTSGKFMPGEEAQARVREAHERFTRVKNHLEKRGVKVPVEHENALFRTVLALREGGLIRSVDTAAFDGILPEHLSRALTLDHHGRYFDPAHPERSATMMLLDRIEKVRKSTRTDHEKIRVLTEEFATLTTDNLGDGVRALQLAEHIPELVSKGGLDCATHQGQRFLPIDSLRKAAHFEDFGLFGTKRVTHVPGEARDRIHGVLANLRVYDALARKHRLPGTDRFGHLTPDAQRALVDGAKKGLEQNRTSAPIRERRTAGFKTSTKRYVARFAKAQEALRKDLRGQLDATWRADPNGAHALAKTLGVAVTESAGRPAEFDALTHRVMDVLDRNVAFFYGNQLGPNLFSRWDAPAVGSEKSVLWNLTSGAKDTWNHLIAVPNGRTAPKGAELPGLATTLPGVATRGDNLVFAFSTKDLSPVKVACALATHFHKVGD